MKSSVKTQRKVINLPKKPVVGSSSFKVTNSRLIGGKCRNTNQVFLDSDEEVKTIYNLKKIPFLYFIYLFFLLNRMTKVIV